MQRSSDDRPQTVIFPAVDAARRGIPVWKSRSPHLHVPTPSVRSNEPLQRWDEYVQAYAMALPDDAVFSHATAALIWGIPLSRRVTEVRTLDVMRARGRPPIVRAGVRSHNGTELRTAVVRDGLRVTSIADTWVDLAAPWLGLRVDELIVAGDAACELIAPTRWESEEVHPLLRPGDVDWLEDPALRGIRLLWETLRARRRHKGKALLAEALPHLRPRVWSPMETRSRLVVTRAGLPEPMLNAWVRGSDGEEILRGDLTWRKRPTVGEYQGAHHEGLEARGADSAKRGLAEAAGWRVVEIFKADIFEAWRRAELIRRLAIHIGVPLDRVNPFVRW